MSGSAEDPPPIIAPRIMAPTIANIGLVGGGSAATEGGSSPSRRRNSVKHRIMQFELGSQKSSAHGDGNGDVSEAGSRAGSLRSRRSEKSNISRIRREELFNLTLHIPMPDGSSASHEMKVTRSYDPKLIAQEVCHDHGLSYAVMGARIENEVNRLVALTCLDHTQTFSEELDSTRQVAIDVHSKQKRENVELKKRLLQAKRIIETYDKRVKKLKTQAATWAAATVSGADKAGDRPQDSTASGVETISEDAALLSAELSNMKDLYASELHQQRLLSEAETEETVAQATEALSNVIQMNEAAYSEELARMSHEMDEQKKSFDAARRAVEQGSATNRDANDDVRDVADASGGDVSQSVKNAVAEALLEVEVEKDEAAEVAHKVAWEQAHQEMESAEAIWQREQDMLLGALQSKLRKEHEAAIEALRQESADYSTDVNRSQDGYKSLRVKLAPAKVNAIAMRKELKNAKRVDNSLLQEEKESVTADQTQKIGRASLSVVGDMTIAEAVSKAKLETKSEYEAHITSLQHQLDEMHAASAFISEGIVAAPAAPENNTIVKLQAQLAEASAASKVETASVADDTAIAQAVEKATRDAQIRHEAAISVLRQELEEAIAAAVHNSSANVSFFQQENESKLGSSVIAVQRDGSALADSSKSVVDVDDAAIAKPWKRPNAKPIKSISLLFLRCRQS